MMNSTEREQLTPLFKKYLNKEVEASFYRKLSERSSIVARVEVKNYPTKSLIVKHSVDLFQDNKIEKSTELREEQLAYKFLEGQKEEKKYKADLLAINSGEIMILEDLGSQDPYETQRSFDYLIPRLAESLAHLHGSTHGEYKTYLQLRNQFGLGSDWDDQRRYGKPAYERLFLKGADFLKNRYQSGASCNNEKDLSTEFKIVFDAIKNPKKFLSFIHDDLGNARQTYELNGDILLLDFEYAKYSHMLLDFVKPMIGKFETNLENGIYQWVQNDFPVELPNMYRTILEENYKISFKKEEWDFNLYCALTYGAICLIGRLCCLEPEKKLLGSIIANMKGILQRLDMLLEEINQGPVIRDYIHCFLKDI